MTRIRTRKSFAKPGTPLEGPLVFQGTASVATASKEVFNRDEVGCGWKKIVTPIPDVSPITSKQIENGLYVLIVQNAKEGPLDAGANADDWNFRYNYFVVRRPGPAVRILLCYAFATAAAYSGADRAVRGGGSNDLYPTEMGGRLRRVSLDRPQVASQWGDAKEEQCIAYAFWMEQFIRKWAAENLGPDAVDVCTSFDLNDDPTLLHDDIALFVSVGHDEYWSRAMREALQAFVERGGNAAFFGANVAWWQVRFEGRIMVCYKSAVEDPDSGSRDELVTANFCGAPACGVEGGHANFEENTLTGVSYRRGAQEVTADASNDFYKVKWTGHRLLHGVKGLATGPPAGATFGAAQNLFLFETDATDCPAEPDASGRTYALGTDGTPTNFEVIAEADLRFTGLDPTVARPAQAGKATMGRFTNGGTVFTVGTTNWGGLFEPDGTVGDADVGHITRNVLETLSERADPPGDPWMLPERTYPGATWTKLLTYPADAYVPALAGIVTGHLLLRKDAAFVRRDPETPGSASGGEQPKAAIPDLPPPAKVASLGSDLYGRFLFAGTADARVMARPGDVDEIGAWQPLALPPEVRSDWPAVGVAGHGKDPFVVFSFTLPPRLVFVDKGKPFDLEVARALPALTESPLFHAETTKHTFERVGWVYPPMRGIASLDGNLFGVRETGRHWTGWPDLCVRQASVKESGVRAVDLLWTKIGVCPPGTYAVGAYYGRLFALAGPTGPKGPSLYWRNCTPEPEFPYREPSMLFLQGGVDDVDHPFAIAQIASDGHCDTTGDGTFRFRYTHVCRANAVSPPTVVTVDPTSPSAPFFRSTTITGRAFFLNAPDGSARLVTFRSRGGFTQVTYPAFSFIAGDRVQWDLVVHVRCGDRDATEPSPIREKVLFYRRDGHLATGEFDEDGRWRGDSPSTVREGWTHIVGTPNGDVFFYNSADGSSEFGRLNDLGVYTREEWSPGTQRSEGTVGPGWKHVVAVGHTYLLFQNRDKKGPDGKLGNVDYVELHDGMVKVRPLELGKSHIPSSIGNGLVLLYDPDTGFVEVWGGVARELIALRSFEENTFQRGWRDILPIGIVDTRLKKLGKP